MMYECYPFVSIFDNLFETQAVFDLSILPVVWDEFIPVLFVECDGLWLFFSSFQYALFIQ